MVRPYGNWIHLSFKNQQDHGTLSPKWKLPKLHENGVNALSVDSGRIAFTGGDDGSITISDLKEHEEHWNWSI